MALYTIGGVDITDLVRQDLADTDSSNYEFTDSQLNKWLVSAVRWYSAHQPYIKETSITTVKNQDIYSLPSDLLWVIECQYRLEFDTNVYTPMEETTLAGYVTYDWPALDLIRRELRVRYDRIGQGIWEVITYRVSYASGKYLVVYPAPKTSGNSFTVRYACAHPLSGTDYFTIPSEHADIFVDLLVARGFRHRAAVLRQKPQEYSAGQTRSRYRSYAEELEREARLREARARNALRSPLVGIG